MRRPILPLLILAACAACAGSATVPSAVPVVPLPAGLPAVQPVAAAEYAARRAAVLERTGDGAVVVLGAPFPPFDYLPFTQDADFRYLTGIVEPAAAWIATKSGGRVREMLFVAERDPAREVWEGPRLGVAGAAARVGIAARPASALTHVLDSLVAAGVVLHATALPVIDAEVDADLTYGQQVMTRLLAKHEGLTVRPLAPVLRNLRAVKSPAELDRIRRAAFISALAHRETMRSIEPGMNEFEIRALAEYMFRRTGADGPAYGSIVGSGPNSTTLHYQTSDRFMNAGEVLLIDAGAAWDGYAADVTRAYPVDGAFTAEQRAVYEIVLAAQKAAEAALRPGATWSELSAAADAEIRAGLARLGLIDAPDATYACGERRCPQYRMYFMHGLGHGVGLAVHDPDVSQTAGRFAVGSAITIEPGVYVRGDVFDHLDDTAENRAMIARLRGAMERYRDIGIRIEDVYVIGANGVERVSASVPRELAEVEALLREPGLDAGTRRADIVEWYRALRGR